MKVVHWVIPNDIVVPNHTSQDCCNYCDDVNSVLDLFLSLLQNISITCAIDKILCEPCNDDGDAKDDA